MQESMRKICRVVLTASVFFVGACATDVESHPNATEFRNGRRTSALSGVAKHGQIITVPIGTIAKDWTIVLQPMSRGIWEGGGNSHRPENSDNVIAFSVLQAIQLDDISWQINSWDWRSASQFNSWASEEQPCRYFLIRKVPGFKYGSELQQTDRVEKPQS